MNPLSAVAISLFLIIYGLDQLAWIKASSKALGVIAIIALIVIVLDTFWINSGRWWAARHPVA